jgi:hypothetical protein
MRPEFQKVFTDITPEYLDSLSISDLCDLLSSRTKRLIQEMADQNPDRDRVKVLRGEVERIQLAYRQKQNGGG